MSQEILSRLSQWPYHKKVNRSLFLRRFFFYNLQYVCHQKTNIKYSPEKLWYIASFVRGMTVDEAVKQLSFVNKKGAVYVKEALLEAQQLAVTEHHVEFRSNLWIGLCIGIFKFSYKCLYQKNISFPSSRLEPVSHFFSTLTTTISAHLYSHSSVES